MWSISLLLPLLNFYYLCMGPHWCDLYNLVNIISLWERPFNRKRRPPWDLFILGITYLYFHNLLLFYFLNLGLFFLKRKKWLYIFKTWEQKKQKNIFMAKCIKYSIWNKRIVIYRYICNLFFYSYGWKSKPKIGIFTTSQIWVYKFH